ncbi:prolipoprotein diacylglyceryl transferase [bacterium]|jgi:phosphatidylglycerol:prolipoprotein diacylglycerol transferase|nr:prolipoprotein diacylglyceryl transferase [bacterium]
MFWQTYLPQSILFSWSFISIHWYGLITVLSILIAGWYALRIAKNKPSIAHAKLDSLFFYLLIFGFVGARLYHVIFFNWNYFSQNLFDIVKIWQGGLAIQGAIVAGILTVFFWSKKNGFKFWKISDWLAPALILGQAIGRWGNYFNQELFGQPTSAAIGIQISESNRVWGYENFSHFHPTFFYESILSLVLFYILYNLTRAKLKAGAITLLYLGGYSLIRFGLEFVRIDPTPMFLGLRLPQVISLLAILAIIALFKVIYKPLPKYDK